MERRYEHGCGLVMIEQVQGRFTSPEGVSKRQDPPPRTLMAGVKVLR
jgi:hypothetical protein